MNSRRYCINIGIKDIWFYFILIPFLYPRGFAELNQTYKLTFTVWIWIAVLIIWMQVLFDIISKKVKIMNRNLFVNLYFILAISITLIIRGNISTGVQQMIAVPSLCVFIIINFKKNWYKMLNVLLNILAILFSVNILLFKDYFEGYLHIGFLGHVQVISQLGIIAIFIAALNYMLSKNKKFKSILVLSLSTITMLSTDADSAVISAIILIVVGIVYKWKLYHLFCLKSKWYVIFMFILSGFMVYITTRNNILSLFNMDYTLSGRSFVWESALLHISQKPIFGFGIDGVMLTTFWTEWSGGGFNYAHNQIMQNLIDGGVVLCISFWLMMLGYASYIDKIKIKKYKILCNAILLVLLFIMIFESTTLYCYMYIFLSILVTLPEVIKERSGI